MPRASLIDPVIRSVKSAIHAGLHGAGYRLVPAARYPEPIAFLRSRRIDTVIDVGANEGQFGKELRESGYLGRIISFEPVLNPFHRLSGVARNSPPWDVHRLALGAGSGRLSITVTAGDDMSSFKKFTRHAKSFASADIVGQEPVEVARLDDVADRMALGRCLLKIDTQGYEEEVLRGATATLPRLLGVLMELPIAHLYEGVWHIEDALKFMRANGFEISGIKPVREDKTDPVSLFEVDVLFKNVRAN